MSKSQTHYRNNNDVYSLEGVEVEAGSLWLYNPSTQLLELVDADQYLTFILDPSLFTLVSL